MFQPIIKNIRRFYHEYEKYLIWLVLTVIFCAAIMWSAKSIFQVYLPFTTWKAFLESIGILGFMFSLLSAWATWREDKKQALQVASARKEEQIFAALEKHALLLSQVELTEGILRDAIASNSKLIEEMRNYVARLSAQVQQTEAESIMQRKILRIEERLSSLKNPSQQ